MDEIALRPGGVRGDVDEAGLVTPEAVVLGLPIASVGSRALALLVDLLVEGLALLVLVFAAQRLQLDGAGAVGVVVVVLTVLLVLYGYPTAMETFWGGRTLGKAALGLRVVTVEGAPVGFRHAAIRAALATVDLYLASGGVAVVAALFTRRGQRLGDLAAGTIVIRERSGAGVLQAATFHPPPGGEGYVDRLDAADLDEGDYQAIRAVLVRGDLAPATREQLAADVASRIRPRVQPPPPDGMPAGVFLACLAAAYQRRHRARSAGSVGDWIWRAPTA